ncbi:hypothetical protein [Neorhizobium sp. DT-125]|uniref:hypothetical protein n=1 Tax=Neorhizobium sp. DT-125 TaxID=3396163 RepID=UPI003F19B940
MKRYGKTAAGRVGTAAMLRALSVLVRHHPRAALDMAGAGLKQAGRSGFEEVKEALTPHSLDRKEHASSDPPASAAKATAEPDTA